MSAGRGASNFSVSLVVGCLNSRVEAWSAQRVMTGS